MIRSVTIATPYCQIAVRDLPGDETLPTLVFLHGNGFSGAVFDAQMNSAILAGHRRIAIDFPGHGASGPANRPNEVYSFAGLGRVIGAVLEALNLNNVILVGWSLGGHVALDMLDSDDRVAGALIFGAPPLSNNPIATLRGLHFSRDMLLASKPRLTGSDAERFEKLCLGDAADGRFVETLLEVDENVRPWLARNALFGQSADQRQLALQARKPLCIVQGSDDPLIRSSYIKELIDDPAFAGQGHILEGVGHAPSYECSDRFDAILARFATAVGREETIDRDDDVAIIRVAA